MLHLTRCLIERFQTFVESMDEDHLFIASAAAPALILIFIVLYLRREIVPSISVSLEEGKFVPLKQGMALKIEK